MPDPIITRDPMRMEEVFRQGKVVGITITLTHRHDDNTLTVTDTWDVPEADQMYAEDWQASKQTLGPGLVGQALEALNIEYQMFTQMRDYIAALPSE